MNRINQKNDTVKCNVLIYWERMIHGLREPLQHLVGDGRMGQQATAAVGRSHAAVDYRITLPETRRSRGNRRSVSYWVAGGGKEIRRWFGALPSQSGMCSEIRSATRQSLEKVHDDSSVDQVP